MRPPWAIDEDTFIERCNRCGECALQCPQNIIRMASGGFPEVDFSAAGCDFCEVCVDVCEPGALKVRQTAAFDLYAEIKDTCLSERGVICRSCGEACDSQAIRFKLVVGGAAQVSMDTDLCNGCGECISTCPADAITIQHRASA